MPAPGGTRKLPWLPISIASVVIVGAIAFLFRDAIFGGGEAADTASDETQEEEPIDEPAAAPEPDLPPEPAEPPPPAIDPAELEAKLADATELTNKRKHDEARAIVDEILAKVPEEPGALEVLAMIHVNQINQDKLKPDALDEPLAAAERCVSADDQRAVCWVAICFMEMIRPQDASRGLTACQKYVELAPEGPYVDTAKLSIKDLQRKVDG